MRRTKRITVRRKDWKGCEKSWGKRQEYVSEEVLEQQEQLEDLKEEQVVEEEAGRT